MQMQQRIKDSNGLANRAHIDFLIFFEIVGQVVNHLQETDKSAMASILKHTNTSFSVYTVC